MNNNNNIQVGGRIKQIRLALGDSMEKFGERFETSKGTVNNWEKGRNLPNKENLKKIADLGNTSVKQLLYGSVDNIIDFELEKHEFYIQFSDLQKQKISNLVKKEIEDFPHLLDDNFNDELTEKISGIIVDVANGLDGTNESALRMSYEAFSFYDLENLFYKTITINETEIRYNYHLMMYQKHYKTKKVLREGMDEQLYQKLKAVHEQATDDITKIAKESGYTLHNLDESKEKTKAQIFELIDKLQSIIPKIARTKKIKKNIEIWVHNNIRELTESPEKLSELINTGALKEVLLGTVEPDYIDMTKLTDPDEESN